MNTAIIITAPNCSQPTYEYLCEQLTRRFGELAFEHRIQPEVLGGFLIQLNGMVYDCTVKTRLDQMKNHLLST